MTAAVVEAKTAELKKKVRHGSSKALLELCERERPTTITELVTLVYGTVLKVPPRRFDMMADTFSVWLGDSNARS